MNMCLFGHSETNMFGSEKGEEFNTQSPEDRVRDEKKNCIYFEKKEIEYETIISNILEKKLRRMFLVVRDTNVSTHKNS